MIKNLKNAFKDIEHIKYLLLIIVINQLIVYWTLATIIYLIFK